MNQRDKEYLREWFIVLRKYGDECTRHYILGYLRSLENHGVINSDMHIKISNIADNIVYQKSLCLKK